MDFSQMIISKFENVIKTFINTNHKSSMTNRFSSVFIVVLCGRFEFEFDDKVIICDKDHPIFIPQGASYKLSCFEYAESLLFNFQTLSPIDGAVALTSINHRTAQEYFDRIDNLASKIHPSSHSILSAFYQFLSEIFPTDTPSSKSEEFVETAEKILIKNFSDPHITLKDIAQRLNISEVYLRKLFTTHRGMPPSKYLTQIRMEKAKMYLLETHSVLETALNVGYSDIYQFSRAYKRHFGYSPSETIKGNVKEQNVL